MGRRLTWAIAFLAAIGTGEATAQTRLPQTKPGLPPGNNPHLFLVASPQAKPAAPAPQPVAVKPADNNRHDRSRQESNRSRPNVVEYVAYVGGGYGYDPYYGYYGYGSDYSATAWPYNPYPPPVYVPTGDLYGPRAVQQFMGVDDWFQPRAAMNDAEAPEPKRPASERATGAKSNALSWKFIGYGDAQFVKENYPDANDRYRKASQSAPQLADAWFRQGFALTAMGRYDLAVGAIKRGLKINPNWAKSAFRLKELYGDDQLAKNAHLDALAEAAELKPTDANLLFLLGVCLHFDGQADRAVKFFQRAWELAGGDAEHIEVLGKIAEWAWKHPNFRHLARISHRR